MEKWYSLMLQCCLGSEWLTRSALIPPLTQDQPTPQERTHSSLSSTTSVTRPVQSAPADGHGCHAGATQSNRNWTWQQDEIFFKKTSPSRLDIIFSHAFTAII